MNLDTSWRSFVLHADEASLKVVFVHIYDTLYAYGLKITQDSDKARDAIHEVFFNLWKYRTRLDTEARALPYLLRAMRNESVRIVQKARNHEDLNGEASRIVFLPQEFQDESLDREERRRVVAGMNTLPPRQREILYLRFYEDMCYKDIATILGISYQSVINQSFRAVTRLRKMKAFSKAYIFSL